MALFDDLTFRGIVKDLTDPELPKILGSQKLTVYAGFDPTADSLHVGSLLPLLTLRRFQLAGHTTIAVVGGATGMIGDPSGKSSERQLLSEDKIQANLAGITKSISRFLDLDSKTSPSHVVNNADWFKGTSIIDFLRDTGKHFTVNYMLGKESVRSRLEDREHGISYTEFSYMLIQAYDYFYLHHKWGCNLQIGGSDQWGNMTAGCELIRRHAAAEGKPSPRVYAMTFPLVNKSDGSKFGKTESGTIWLDAGKTSPYQFYQYFLQTPDADVMNYLKYFTFLSKEELHTLEAALQANPQARHAQKRLAQEFTSLVHGPEEVKKTESASGALFGSSNESLQSLDASQLETTFASAPKITKDRRLLIPGVLLLDLLVESGLYPSKGTARKDMVAGGASLNNNRITDPQRCVTQEDLVAGLAIVLRKGKKNYALVYFKP